MLSCELWRRWGTEGDARFWWRGSLTDVADFETFAEWFMQKGCLASGTMTASRCSRLEGAVQEKFCVYGLRSRIGRRTPKKYM